MDHGRLFLILLDAYALGLGAGIAAAIYREVLAYEPILHWWFKFGNRFEGLWFYRPVWACGKCVAGQLAGWSWLFVKIIPAIVSHWRHFKTIGGFSIHTTQTAGFYFLGLISAICAAVLVAIIVTHILNNKYQP